jgi:membrane protease YdiL (CAAX protease family)
MIVTKKLYLAGVLVVFASSYAQYLIHGLNQILDILLVYGVPILVISLLFGREIVSKSFNRTFSALKFGLGFYGAFTLLGTIAGVAIFSFLSRLDPSALNLLHRPNPVLNVPPEAAWIMVVASILIVGPAEEYIFRGFVYGYLLRLFANRHWLSLALVSSFVFAAVHLYYALVYGLASLVQFADLVAFGMAMAVTYYVSGGNLFIPALIHGVYDATGFLGIATSSAVGVTLRGLMLLIGLIVALLLLIQRRRKQKTSIQ